MATATRTKTWISGDILTASDLNAEFNGLLGALALGDSDVSGGIAASKISGTAVTLTGSQVLTNKTLTSPTITTPTITSPVLTVGSDAQGDVYYRGSGGFTRLGPGTSGYFLKTQGASSDPVWAAVTITPNIVAYNAAAAYTTTSTSFVDVDATNLKPTIVTTNSNKVRILVTGTFKGSTTQTVAFRIVRNPAGTPVVVAYQNHDITGSIYRGFSIALIDSPTTGSNVYTLQWITNTGTVTMAESTYYINMSVEEIQAG